MTYRSMNSWSSSLPQELHKGTSRSVTSWSTTASTTSWTTSWYHKLEHNRCHKQEHKQEHRTTSWSTSWCTSWCTSRSTTSGCNSRSAVWQQLSWTTSRITPTSSWCAGQAVQEHHPLVFAAGKQPEWQQLPTLVPFAAAGPPLPASRFLYWQQFDTIRL